MDTGSIAVSVDDELLLLRSGFLSQFVSHVRLAYGKGENVTALATQTNGLRLIGPQEETGQEHLADCSSKGLGIFLCLSHCTSLY